MTEEEARAWVAARFDAAVIARLEQLVAHVVSANQRQNLIAPSTIDHMWERHIVDSLQLLTWAQPGTWLDIGSGAGFPGLVIAAAEPDRDVVLVEPRKLRVEHLTECADAMGLRQVDVICARANSVNVASAVISARAVAATSFLFSTASRCADLSTIWLLPKGRNAEADLAEARQRWHGVFHVEQSITSPDSKILIAQDVRPR